jgi:hypothetical protein
MGKRFDPTLAGRSGWIATSSQYRIAGHFSAHGMPDRPSVLSSACCGYPGAGHEGRTNMRKERCTCGRRWLAKCVGLLRRGLALPRPTDPHVPRAGALPACLPNCPPNFPVARNVPLRLGVGLVREVIDRCLTRPPFPGSSGDPAEVLRVQLPSCSTRNAPPATRPASNALISFTAIAWSLCGR